MVGVAQASRVATCFERRMSSNVCQLPLQVYPNIRDTVFENDSADINLFVGVLYRLIETKASGQKFFDSLD
jgi:hypothetical protein